MNISFGKENASGFLKKTEKYLVPAECHFAAAFAGRVSDGAEIVEKRIPPLYNR